MAIAPKKIRFHRLSQEVTFDFGDGFAPRFSAEFLRVHSPSAEVKGHGPDQAVLQVGKRDVKINALEPAGNYAVKILFDDGHDTGLFSWDYLTELGQHQSDYWQAYLDKLDQAGLSRERDVSVVRFIG